MSPGRAGAGSVALVAVVAFAGSFFGAGSLPAAAVQAAIAEWGAERLGVDWSETKATRREVTSRAARGIALGLGAAAAMYLAAIATRAPIVAGAWTTGPLVVGVTLANGLMRALRDEMITHGLPLRVIAPAWAPTSTRRALAVVACGIASAAWAVGNAGDTGMPLDEVAFELLAGAAFGALWLRDRGAWLPIAARFAFSVARPAASGTAPALVVAFAACAGATTYAAARENSARRAPSR